VAHIGVDHIRLRPTLRERVAFDPWIGNAEHRKFLDRHGIADTLDREPFRRAITENQGGERVAVRYSNTRTAVWPHPAELFKDLYWCEEAAEFLAQPRERPFALFLYLWAPHPPLIVPEPYASRFPPDQIDLPANVGIPAEGEPANRRLGIAAQLAEGVPLDQWRRVWAAHLGLVSLADAGIGKVLDALDASGQAENTITVFTVDHGEQLGQHAMYQKMEMYEPAVRIPLVVRVPGGPRRSWDAPVSHVDVMPTLLELLGLDGPAGLDGVSLASSVAGGSPPPERPVFCQYSGNPAVGDIRRAVITRRHKYVHDPADEPELYDLEADPLEMHNLAREPSAHAALRELHGLCRRWAASHGDWVAF
jgi:arylsulfatase A-like enzyme